MTSVRIYQPAKTAMQSGKGKTAKWIIDFGPDRGGYIDGRLGWYGSGDTNTELHLSFATREDAVAYALSQGWSVTAAHVGCDTQTAPVVQKSYSDHFSATRRRFTVPS